MARIVPVWHPPGEYGRIEEILRELVERSARTEPVVPAGAKRRPPIPMRTREHLEKVPLERTDHCPEAADVARAIRGGRVAFFLGAYAHLGRLPLGDAFYTHLAQEFECPTLSGDCSAVAAFVASRRGTGVLWREVKETLTAPIEPSAVHRLVAAIPSFLRSEGTKRSTWILTTNYDTVLERALTEAGEPFHLLYYMEEEGLFAHTAPDGSVRVIERPEAIRTLPGAGPVVVKLNGGIVTASPPTESVVIASGQFERLAGRLPAALPECVVSALHERSLLFLGHGLAEPDVYRLIQEFAAGDGRDSWAVQLPPGDRERLEAWRERAKHFEGLGLRTIVCDLEAFVADLGAELLAA